MLISSNTVSTSFPVKPTESPLEPTKEPTVKPTKEPVKPTKKPTKKPVDNKKYHSGDVKGDVVVKGDKDNTPKTSDDNNMTKY